MSQNIQNFEINRFRLCRKQLCTWLPDVWFCANMLACLGPCYHVCPFVKMFFLFMFLQEKYHGANVRSALKSEESCEQEVGRQGISKYTKLCMRRQINTNKIISVRTNQINTFIKLEGDESRRMRSCVHLLMSGGTTFSENKSVLILLRERALLMLHKFKAYNGMGTTHCTYSKTFKAL